MKLILKIAIVLLLLPLLTVYALFIYGKYMIHIAEENRESFNAHRQEAIGSGNGFGGEVGLEVLDSGYKSEKFFWIDDDRLVFETSYSGNAPKDIQRNYVWSISENTIKPLMIEGGISSFYDNHFHYARFSETEVWPNGRKKADRFQSTLAEQDEIWLAESSRNMKEVLNVPSENYEIAWNIDGKPWFRIKSGLSSESDVPKHRFLYLWEWGWILRMPWVGPEHWDQTFPEMGFFDIGGKAYFGQKGEKKAELIDIPIKELPGLEVVYVEFLDRFWLANSVDGDTSRKTIMGFIDRGGRFDELVWPGDWPVYLQVPVPTRKGLFWSGKDYRLKSPTAKHKGAYIRAGDGRIHKVIAGSALRSRLSNDGCIVAFFNTPREDDRRSASLKTFNVCKSTIDAKELRNVDY